MNVCLIIPGGLWTTQIRVSPGRERKKNTILCKQTVSRSTQTHTLATPFYDATISVSSASRLKYKTILKKIGAVGTKDKVSGRRCHLSIKERVYLTICNRVESWKRDISQSVPSAFERSVFVLGIKSMFSSQLHKGVILALW